MAHVRPDVEEMAPRLLAFAEGMVMATSRVGGFGFQRQVAEIAPPSQRPDQRVTVCSEFLRRLSAEEVAQLGRLIAKMAVPGDPNPTGARPPA